MQTRFKVRILAINKSAPNSYIVMSFMSSEHVTNDYGFSQGVSAIYKFALHATGYASVGKKSSV